MSSAERLMWFELKRLLTSVFYLLNFSISVRRRVASALRQLTQLWLRHMFYDGRPTAKSKQLKE